MHPGNIDTDMLQDAMYRLFRPDLSTRPEMTSNRRSAQHKLPVNTLDPADISEADGLRRLASTGLQESTPRSLRHHPGARLRARS